jgi:hypothetical protein
MSPEDRDLAIRTMLAEAGNGGASGMVAVANTILNRVKSGRYGQGVRGVVLAKSQFEPWSPHVRGTANDPRRFSPNDAKYKEAADLLDAAASGVIPDITGGATHFYAPEAQSALGRNTPKWATPNAMTTPKMIGGHRFFAPEGKVNYDPSQFDTLSRSSLPTGIQLPKPVQGMLPGSAPALPADGFTQSRNQQMSPMDRNGLNFDPMSPKPMSQQMMHTSPKPPGSWGDVFGGWAGDSMGSKRDNPLAFRLLQYAMQPSPGSGGPGADVGGGLSSANPSAPPEPAAGTPSPDMGGGMPMPGMGGGSSGGKPDLPGVLGMFSKMFSGGGATSASGAPQQLASAMPQLMSSIGAPAAAGASAAAPAAAAAAPAGLSALSSLFAMI